MEEQEPTIEEIKKIANQKRPKKPTEYNEFIKKQMELFKGQNINPKEKMKLATQEWQKQKEINGKKEDSPIPPPKPFTRKKKVVKEPKLEPIIEPNNHVNEIKETIENEIKPKINYDELHNNIEILKEMVKNQNNFIQESLKPKPRAKPKPKPKMKRVNNTLDLTITDNEINKIINDKEPEPKGPQQDEKIKAFLDALLKRN